MKVGLHLLGRCVVLVGLLCALVGACAGNAQPAVRSIPKTLSPSRIEQSEPFVTLARRGTTKKQWAAAIAKLPKVTSPKVYKESPTFWKRIANDSKLPIFHRRSAALQLFRRHVFVGMSLIQLSRMLEGSTWLRTSHIHRVRGLNGRIPVQYDPSDSIFVIRVFPSRNNSHPAIYLSFEKTEMPQMVFERWTLAGPKTEFTRRFAKVKVGGMAISEYNKQRHRVSLVR